MFGQALGAEATGSARSRGALGGRKAAMLGCAGLFALVAASDANAQCVGGGGPQSLLNLSALAGSGSGTVNSLVSTLNTVNTAFLTQSTAFVGAPGNPAPGQPGGGTWDRVIGGSVETRIPGVANLGGTFVGTQLPNETISCNTRTRLDFYGAQTGADISRLNIAGGNLHFGVTTGYSDSTARDVGGGARSNFQVPFVGLYAAYTMGGLFIDGQVRGDFFNINVTDPDVGLVRQNFEARSTSVTGNIGYNFGLGNGWFIEPSAGVVYSRTKVDPLNLAGTFVNLNSPGFAPPGTLRIGEIESILGRASVRFGTNITANGVALQPFFTASVFNEFAGNVTTTYSGDLGNIFGVPGLFGTTSNGALTTGRVGTYGQFAVGIAAQVLNTGWLGYARVDYRTGERIEGFSVNAGLRYQFTPEMLAVATGGIFKAPVKAPAGPVVQAVNWSGLYGGYYGGTTWGEARADLVGVGRLASPRPAGYLGGVDIGYNYQVGSFVFGVEGDGFVTNAMGARSCGQGFQFLYTCESRVDWVATATGRLGYAVDRTLFFVKGGGAWAGERALIRENVGGLFGGGGQPASVLESVRGTIGGYTVGAGFEFALTQNWSAKVEYDYMDFGRHRVTGNGGDVFDFGTTVNVVKIGSNYRFNSDFFSGGPVVARY